MESCRCGGGRNKATSTLGDLISLLKVKEDLPDTRGLPRATHHGVDVVNTTVASINVRGKACRKNSGTRVSSGKTKAKRVPLHTIRGPHLDPRRALSPLSHLFEELLSHGGGTLLMLSAEICTIQTTILSYTIRMHRSSSQDDGPSQANSVNQTSRLFKPLCILVTYLIKSSAA